MCFDEPLDCAINEDELKIMSFNEILDTEFNRKSAVIDGLLYRGTYVLAGAPKSGKSFLAEQIAFHVATGTPLWNYEVRQGTVLYLALEDTYKRLQTRLYRMFRTSEAKNLYFATYAHSLDNGLLDSLNLFIDKHGDTSLIIIDTLQKVREASNNYSYSKDYEVISALKQFADTRGCCLLLIHHTRKQKADDVFEMISGTNGILGSADGAMILNKANRTDTSAILSVSGRDQADMRIKLKRNPTTLAWNMVAVEQEVYEESNDPIIEAIARFVNDNQPQWSGTATELNDLLSLNMKPNALSRHLNVHSLDLIEKHIHYSTSRSHTGRKITLNYENNSNEAEKHVC